MKNTLNNIKHDLSTCNIVHLNPNLSNAEKDSLQKLMKDEDLIIAKADKGNSVVLILTTKYLEITHEHVNDNKTYRLLLEDPTTEIKYRFIIYHKIVKQRKQSIHINLTDSRKDTKQKNKLYTS